MATDDGDINVDPWDYKLCCLYNDSHGKCGPFTSNRQALEGLKRICDLDADTESHIKNLKFKEQPLKWTERSLIENRVKRQLDTYSLICEHRRNTLGIAWRPKKHCLHPKHPDPKQGQKTCATELAPLWIVKKLNSHTPFSFILGARICDKHRKYELQQRKSEKAEETVSTADEEVVDNVSYDDETDLTYQPDQVYVPEAMQTSSRETGEQLTQLLMISPLRTIRKPVSLLSDSAKQTLKRKLHEVQTETVRCFAECVAPNQSDEVLKYLQESSDDDDEIPPDLAPLIPVYKESGSKEKLIVLSLVDHSRHTKDRIQEYFGCSKYQVDMARKLRSIQKGLTIPERKPIRRNKLNTYKMEHFIEFLFASGLLQDVAYGVTKIKFDSGTVQTIPHAILTSKYSHTVAFYLQMCNDVGFQPLSGSTLIRILNVLKPSRKRNLAGLDDITAAGMTAFEKLKQFISDKKKDKRITDQMEKGKRHLKINYQSQCSTDSDIASHNSTFALSTLKEEPSQSVGDDVCNDCFTLFSSLEEILSVAKEIGTEEELYNVNQSVNNVIIYMKHHMRDFQQRKAKAFCMENISETTGFSVRCTPLGIVTL